MKKMKKIMALMPLATTLLPLTAFADTSYVTTTEDVTYENDITMDKEKNDCEVLVTQTSTFSVKIPKTVILNGMVGQANDSDYDVVVKGNIASDEVIKVIPDATFFMKDVKTVKDDIQADVTQGVIKFVNAESKEKVYKTKEDTAAIDVVTEVGKITGNIKVNDLTAGSWQGIFNFSINLEKAEVIS